MNNQILRCIGIILLCSHVYAIGFGQGSDTTRFIIEEGWIERMMHQASYKLALSNDAEVFNIDTETNDFEIYPNTASIVRLSFNYRFISVSAKFAPDFLPGNGDNDTKGNTKTTGIGTDIILPHWFHNLSYNRVKGYYLNNTSDYDPLWTSGDPYIQFPDLVYKNFQIISGYKFNPKFSFRALSSQTERQLKSAGSFMPSIRLRYYIVDDRSEITPTGLTQKSNNFEISVGAGYQYTFVIQENFYFSLGFTPGIGRIYNTIFTRTQNGELKTKQRNTIVRWDGVGGFGYNGRKFFSGALLNLTATSFEQENSTVINSDTRAFFQVFVGVRLKAPQKLKETVGKF